SSYSVNVGTSSRLTVIGTKPPPTCIRRMTWVEAGSTLGSADCARAVPDWVRAIPSMDRARKLRRGRARCEWFMARQDGRGGRQVPCRTHDRTDDVREPAGRA